MDDVPDDEVSDDDEGDEELPIYLDGLGIFIDISESPLLSLLLIDSLSFRPCSISRS